MRNDENRLAYQVKIEALLKQWGSQINTWQRDGGDMMQPFITELNQKRQVVKSKLEELRLADDDHWQGIKTSMDQSVEDMEQAIIQSQQQSQNT